MKPHPGMYFLDLFKAVIQYNSCI